MRLLAPGAALLVAAATAGCGGANSNPVLFPHSRDTTTTLYQSTTTTLPTTEIGSTVPLTNPQGIVIKAKATGVVDPATGTSGPPQAGSRYLAVTLELTDDSQVAILGDPDGDPTIAAYVVSNTGDVFPNVLATVAECSGFPHTQVNLRPGQTATGCLVFDVPLGAQIVRFEFSPTQEFGQTGTWLLSS